MKISILGNLMQSSFSSKPPKKECTKKDKRLLQMRQSQQNLRDRRNAEIAALKVQADMMKKYLKSLETSLELISDSYIDDTRMTNHKAKKLRDLFTYEVSDADSMSIEEFTEKYNFHSSHLYTDEGFILVYFCTLNSRCYRKFLNCEVERPLSLHTLKFIKMYGATLPAKYYQHLDFVAKHSRIPKCWIGNDEYLPPNFIGVVEILRRLDKDLNVERTNIEVLLYAVTLHLFATPFGPAIRPDDLDWAIELSYNPKFDIYFLMESVEAQLGKIPPASVIRSLANSEE